MLPTKTLAATTIPKLNIFLVDGWIDSFKQQQVWQQTLLLRQLGSRTAEAYITLPYWHSHKARVGNGWCGMGLWGRQRSKALTCIFLRLFSRCIAVFTSSNDPLGHYGWYRESIITCLSWPGRLERLSHRDRSPAMAMPITWPLYCTPRDPENEISSNTHLLPNRGTS